jgi:hypothetical protein
MTTSTASLFSNLFGILPPEYASKFARRYTTLRLQIAWRIKVNEMEGLDHDLKFDNIAATLAAENSSKKYFPLNIVGLQTVSHGCLFLNRSVLLHMWY